MSKSDRTLLNKVAMADNPSLTPEFPAAENMIENPTSGDSGRKVGAGHAGQWIASGWRLFRRQPGIWVLLTLVFGLIAIVLSVIPVFGQLALVLLGPVFVGGMMLACRKVERGEELDLADLFAGFRRNTGSLITVALIGLAFIIAIVIPITLLTGAGAMFASMAGADSAAMVGAGALLGFLLILALTLPVNMALWFAPALVILEDQAPTRAVARSFRACIRNLVPFVLYGLILFVLAFIASLPLGLGWLVLGPVVVGSVYAAYQDIFGQR